MEKMRDPLTETTVANRLATLFFSRFGSEARIFRAPGRVNLIGEHTDYNDGFVLPAAIRLYTWTAIAPRTDRKLLVFSENLDEAAEIDLNDRARQPRDDWPDYIHGVALMLQRLGISLRGANIALHSNVPVGAGLSSSAALEVSIASALLAISDQTLNLKEVATLCQRAENEFVGVHVGIMDQFASCFGHANKAILLDCRTLDYKLLPLPAGLTMVICNTMVKHGHSGGEYNERRLQCEQGVQQLKRFFPSVKALRDVTLEQIESHRTDLPELTYRRCHHVISENERVLKVVEGLQKGDLAAVGRCMTDSHLSLKDDYEVSCRELDTMVEAAAGRPGAIGSRMTGGGFGGCTINLVKTESVEAFRQNVKAAYQEETNIEPEVYVSTAGAGVMEVPANG
jgi:galactokinase